MPWLNKGRVLRSDATQMCYRVTSHRVAQGGFGEIYRGVALDDHDDPWMDVAIKVSMNPLAWHGEAYFGRLLAGYPHVVPMKDAFPLIDGAGPARRAKYILVFPWMSEGTVDDYLQGDSPQPWSEAAVEGQIAALLDVLELLHRRGICHGDITPRNVFVQDGCLLLGDLGIAKQGLEKGPIEMIGATPEVFAPRDVDPFYWSPSEDVYQVGLIALSLLSGQQVTTFEICGRLLRALDASDQMKGWIHEALAEKGERFEHASEAKEALLGKPVKPARAPKNLCDQGVVFTGKLPIPRVQAQAQARAVGAVIQAYVSGATTLIVAGQPNPLQIGQERGTKLFDAHKRIRRGQRIAIINAKRFIQLVASGKAKRRR